MTNEKTWKELHIKDIDFIQNADNVYRTRNHIVAQKIRPVSKGSEMITMLGSEDRYYTRTSRRDAEYDLLFKARDACIEGKRIRTAFYTRKYIK